MNMKKIMIAMLVGGFGLGLAKAQQPMAAEQKPEMKKEMKKEMKEGKKHEKKEKMNMCKGTVEAVDAAMNRITVKDGKGMTMVMPIAAETKIIKAGKPATLADVMVGEKIHIMYEGTMENPMVKSVKIESKPMKKEKGMKKGPKTGEPKM